MTSRRGSEVLVQLVIVAMATAPLLGACAECSPVDESIGAIAARASEAAPLSRPDSAENLLEKNLSYPKLRKLG